MKNFDEFKKSPNMFIALGVVMGTVVGIVFDSMMLGLAIGILVGVILTQKAKDENKED